MVLAHLTLGHLKSPIPCLIQIMLLETARRYNHETECITFLKDFTYSKDDFHRAGLWRALAQGPGVSAPLDLQVGHWQDHFCHLALWQEIRKKHLYLRLTHGARSWRAHMAVSLRMGLWATAIQCEQRLVHVALGIPSLLPE